MRYREVLICLGFLVLEVSLQAANFANNLAKCIETKDVDDCLRETMDQLRRLMPVGIPELNLRRSEPFEVDNLEFNSDPGIVDVRAKFSNVVVRGLSKFKTNHISADIYKQTISLGITVPRMDITGQYVVDGQVIIFKVNGAGNFIAALHDVTGDGRATIRSSPDNSKLEVSGINFDFNVGRAQVRMHNLFNGELPALAKRVNHWISDNSDLVINAVKPQIKREVTVIVEKVLNDAFRKVPASDFIANLDRKKAREGGSNSPSSPRSSFPSSPSSSFTSSSSFPSGAPPPNRFSSRPVSPPRSRSNGFNSRFPPPPPIVRGSGDIRFSR